MRARPLSPDALAATIAQRLPPGRVRVAVDGPPTARPGHLAEILTEQVQAAGRFALHVPAEGFLRAASLRFERGRTNPDAFYEDWLDLKALTREVLTTGGRVLPSLWDPVRDRATRAGYVQVPDSGVVIVSGTMLLGAGLDFDLTAHLVQTPAALARRMPAEQAWTLPAYARYADEVMPDLLADLVVRADDPDHPALVEQP